MLGNRPSNASTETLCHCSVATRSYSTSDLYTFPCPKNTLSSYYVPSDNIKIQIQLSLNRARSLLSSCDQDIQSLEQHLSNLRASKSALQTYIAHSRHILAPIRQLPVEVLISIFKYLLDPYRISTVNSSILHITRTLLIKQDVASVCIRWRDILLSSPILWRNICIRLGDVDGHLSLAMTSALVQLYLQRSYPIPLRIFISFRRWNHSLLSPAETILGEIFSSSSRWLHAEFWNLQEEDLDRTTYLNGNAPLLKSLLLHQNIDIYNFPPLDNLPSLSSVHLECLPFTISRNEHGVGFWSAITQLTFKSGHRRAAFRKLRGILGAASSLQTLHLISDSYTSGSSPQSEQIHSNLTTLIVDLSISSNLLDMMLHIVIFPRLKHLEISSSHAHIVPEQIIDFLRRSPLLHDITFRGLIISEKLLLDILVAIPNASHLCISVPPSLSIITELSLNRLTDDLLLLPHLQYLELSFGYSPSASVSITAMLGKRSRLSHLKHALIPRWVEVTSHCLEDMRQRGLLITFDST